MKLSRAVEPFDPEAVQAFVPVMLLRKEPDPGACNKKYLESALPGPSPLNLVSRSENPVMICQEHPTNLAAGETPLGGRIHGGMPPVWRQA